MEELNEKGILNFIKKNHRILIIIKISFLFNLK